MLRAGLKIGDVELIRPDSVRYSAKRKQPGWVCRFWWGEERVLRSDYLLRVLRKKTHRWGNRPLEEVSFEFLFRSYKGQARRRNHEWALNREEFKKITKQTCHYCDAVPAQKAWYRGKTGTNYTYNGIDRIDNRKGYVLANCVPACSQCNRAKGTLTYEQFMIWVRKVAQAA